MTVERRIVAGIGDIKTVRLKCTTCGAVRVLPVNALMGVGVKCGNTSCAQTCSTADADNLKHYLEAFHNLRTAQSSAPFELSFEFEDAA
jgi:hypothetical protein